jgi:murein DD-endopeptidase MepM/ murein hydrolase activator NlpD
MSSLHQDRLLAEGSDAETGSAKTLATARGTSRRPAEKKATSTVPTPRTGMALQTGTTPTTDAADRPARSAGTRTASAKAATVKAAAAKAKAATAKAASAKAATVAKAEASAIPAATIAEAPVRPTPYKRSAPVAEVVSVEVVAESVTARSEAEALAPEAPAVVSTVAAGGLRARLLRRRPPSIGRRPALYLAAALIGAMGVGTITTPDSTAEATQTASHSVSVAQELGIEAAPAQAISDVAAAELLGELAVSRSVRDAEQAAAAQVQAEADRVAAEAAAAAAAEAARPKAVLPVDGARLTSGFGARWGKLHAGIDLAAPMRTPEYAAMDGVVLEAGPASGYGLVVYIQHENGDVTAYGHMDEILVQPGQVVRAGETIALLGNRGQSTGPHLHFEVHVGGLNGEKIDPLPWLRDNGVAI